MNDPTSRGHPVDFAWDDGLNGTQTIAVYQLTFEQVGDGGQIDVRMRTYVDSAAWQELRRAHVIEEDEGSHRPSRYRRQNSPHFESSDIARPRLERDLDGRGRFIAGPGRSQLRHLGR